MYTLVSISTSTVLARLGVSSRGYIGVLNAPADTIWLRSRPQKHTFMYCGHLNQRTVHIIPRTGIDPDVLQSPQSYFGTHTSDIWCTAVVALLPFITQKRKHAVVSTAVLYNTCTTLLHTPAVHSRAP